MPLITEDELRNRSDALVCSRKRTAGQILAEAAPTQQVFDVFLSHSSKEPEDLLLGIKGLLEDAGLTVYVDRYTDPDLHPEKVTPETTSRLRARLRSSRSLLYVYSRKSTLSRWMPWELGFMGGKAGRVGIVPVAVKPELTFNGEQYLSLYPYVDRARITGRQGMALWINRNQEAYADLKRWLAHQEEIWTR